MSTIRTHARSAPGRPATRMRRPPHSAVAAPATGGGGPARRPEPPRQPTATAGGPAAWRVGHAVADITPDPSAGGAVWLAGYGVRRAAAVRDPLEAHALALRHAGASLIVVTLDLLGLGRGETGAVERLARDAIGADAPPVVTCCTHTHAAPDTLGLWGPDGARGVDPAYLARVVAMAAETAARAWQGMRPATLRAAEAAVVGVARNARDPGVLDPTLTLLSWDDPQDGHPLARVLHFACHPEALGPEDARLSADLAGVARRRVSSASGCPCVFWQGALGGMVTPDARPGESGEEACSRLGGGLGDAATALAHALRPAAGGLALVRREVLLPQENARFAAAQAAGVLQRETVGPPRAAAAPVPHVRSSAGLLRLGRYLWQLAPGEVLPAVARRWAADARAARPDLCPRVLGLCDDEVGYILRAEDFTPDGYEETVSLGPHTEAILRRAYAEMLGAAVVG